MVVSTIVENGKTVRAWQERRGGKTLTREFYLKYRVNAICNGVHHTLAICDTLCDAEKSMLVFKSKIDVKYRPKKWLNTSSRTPLTHIEKVGFLSTFGAEKSVSLYLTEESFGETKSEVWS